MYVHLVIQVKVRVFVFPGLITTEPDCFSAVSLDHVFFDIF